MRIRLWIAATIVAGIAAAGTWWFWPQNEDLPTPTLNTDARDLKESEVTAWLDRPIVEGKSIVWCGTMQLAWNVISDDMAKEPLHLQGTPEMETQLNKRQFTAADVDPTSYLAEAGLVNNGIVDKINSNLQTKFGSNVPRVQAPADAGPTGIMIYAYLEKHLDFWCKFQRQKEPLAWAGSTERGAQLMAFGVEGLHADAESGAARQVVVHDYATDDDFVVELTTKANDEQLILALVPPAGTLLETIERVQKRVAAEATPESESYSMIGAWTLKVPLMDFNITRQFDEINKRSVLNTKLRDDTIVDTSQRIRWRLTEKGAVVKSEATIGDQPTSAAVPLPHVQPHLIFNRPFLLYIQRKDAKLPYFAMWIANPELLIKTEK